MPRLPLESWIKRNWLVQRLHASAIRTRLRVAVFSDRAAVVSGSRLTHLAFWVLRLPHRTENVTIPTGRHIDRFELDVVEDLIDYTGLRRDQVIALLRRKHDSFRLEWYSFPEALREEQWYYLSSRAYLFGNAVHSYDAEEFLAPLTVACSPPARALDFGGGAGNLALALGAKGYDVDFLELSALQKDFVRYRVSRRGLHERVRILDWWDSLPAGAYDLICALDVLEHLPNLANVLERELLPALAPGGILAESSPFARNISNPMHHQDEAGLDSLLEHRGLRLLTSGGDFRLWRLP